MHAAFLLAAALALAVTAAPAGADDVYAQLPLATLELTAGELPVVSNDNWMSPLGAALHPYAFLAGEGDAYVLLLASGSEPRWRVGDARLGTLMLRVPEARAVRGWLCLPGADGLRKLEFAVPAEAFSSEGRKAFLEAEARHYEALLERGLPGAAWFRHRARAARAARGSAEPEPAPTQPVERPWGNELDETYELFSGGRALAENLQLDRELPFTQGLEATVALDSIPGVATAAYDWKAEIEGLEPALDPLARCVPADQHAVFFPSFEAFVATLDELEADATPLLELHAGTSEDARSRARYERQLCLPLDQRTRALGPLVIGALALTGSDPYLRVGSDLALVFESRSAPALRAFVRAEQERALDETEGATLISIQRQGVECEGVITPDRSLCSYAATLAEGLVVVTNSLQQLDRLIEAERGETEALAGAPEYAFFRYRYPLGADGEQALLVLTDATIRRWCGPRWRIGASRRTQAAAWIADAQAAWLARAAGLGPDELPGELPDGSALAWGERGARSERWGTTEFLTPIAELDIERVTPAEEQAYGRFRDRYQRNWSAWFDPIAVRLSRRAGEHEADVTVRPLIAGSDYREWMEIVGAAALAPFAADPHEGTLLHFALALDTRSEPFRMAGGLLGGGRKDPTFGWIGDGLGVYVEPDPFLDGWRAAERDGDDWFEDHLGELPLVLYVESRSPLELAVFLTSLRAFVEGSGPGLTEWSTREHEGQTYVRIGAAPEARDMMGPVAELAIWYASLPDALIVTLREDLLLRAVQRHAARRAGTGAAGGGRAWQGSSLALRLDGALLDLVRDLSGENEQFRRQAMAWTALPILREWKRLFPDQDPLAVHERAFGVRLVDPGGGEYVWDGEWATWASTRYGHPGAPLEGPIWPPALERVSEIDLGVTFEQDGLRARALLRRE